MMASRKDVDGKESIGLDWSNFIFVALGERGKNEAFFFFFFDIRLFSLYTIFI